MCFDRVDSSSSKLCTREISALTFFSSSSGPENFLLFILRLLSLLGRDGEECDLPSFSLDLGDIAFRWDFHGQSRSSALILDLGWHMP